MTNRKKRTVDCVVNQIVAPGLFKGKRLAPGIRKTLNSMGIRILKMEKKNGEPHTQNGDRLVLKGPKITMLALAKMFPKGFLFKDMMPYEEWQRIRKGN